MVCNYCSKECKNLNSLKQHEVRCKQNPNRIEPSHLSHVAWNKGKKTGNFQKIQLYSCKFCKKEWITTGSGRSWHEAQCKANPNRRPGTFTGRKRTEEEKAKISEGQKRAHKEGRNNPWIGRRKRSYAEQSWYNIFVKAFGEGNFENNFSVTNSNNSSYFLDFAWPQKKIYFEVDGETHYTEEGILHDSLRDSYLKEQGWKLIGRCRWAEYQKLSQIEKENYVQSILNMI